MGRKVEILAPAGSKESLEAAVCAGADAVYIGGMRFGARAYAKNLSREELSDAIDYVHIHGRRIYLTVNTLLRDSEIGQLYDYLLPYVRKGIDAVIVQDIGVIGYLRRYFPGLPIHASTQMTITGPEGAEFLKERGITRVVPARELSLSEIRKMKEQTGLEIECFVHGALCYCYSGQCLLSSMIGGRSGNRGQCAQPCRLPYRAKGRTAADLMSLKDLCTIEILPKLMEAGIDSFKIEGRMKQPDYVYTVVQMYRKYADLCQKGGQYQVAEADRQKLLNAYQRRGYTRGYYEQHNGKSMISLARPAAPKEEKTVPDVKIKEKINGNLILSPGKRAKLVITCGECRTECEGETVMPALQKPLDAERVEKQMRKTGNTEFTFDHLRVQADGEVFLPVQALNELRRTGIEKLAACILKKYRRKEDGFRENESSREIKSEGKPQMKETGYPEETSGETKPSLAVMVQSLEQLEAAASYESVDVIYIDGGFGMPAIDTRAGRRKLYLAMPHIFRMEEMRNWEAFYDRIVPVYDGVLIRNWESFRWLKKHGYEKEIRLDQNLYVFNRYGKAFIEDAGVSNFTAPLELNARELRELDIRGAALGVYGYQPVMVTANCIQKTVEGCRKKEGYLFIRDRYQKQFAVRRCCRCCYNVIYNSAPLFLADQAEEIRRLAPGELRLDFTVETAEEVRYIIGLYIDAFVRCRDVKAPEFEYTRGHFKRGVK